MAPPKKSRSSSKRKGTPKPAVVAPEVRYNPNSEPGDLGPVIASNWEILRRTPAFQKVAKQWVASENFRFQHVLEQKSYGENSYARCALDWMLSPEERYSLAEFQMKNRRFFKNPMDNFGPLIIEFRWDGLTTSLALCIENMYLVKPELTSVGRLGLDQPWPASPGKFRSQFSSIFESYDLQEIKLDEPGITLMRLANELLGSKTITSEEQTELGRYLFQLGDHFLQVSKEFKLPAIRREVFYPEKRIDDILARIKASLPVDPKTGNDYESNRSFLGTADQWSKFLAWEAHGRNSYRAAAEIIPQPAKDAAMKTHLRGVLSMSALQNRYKTSILQAVKAIEKWYGKIYPLRNLAPTSVHRPSA